MDTRYFLISTDGRHCGPLSPGDVRVWLADGRASRHSRARRDGETAWMPLREMPEFEEVTRPPYVGGGSPSDPPDADDNEAPPRADAAFDNDMPPVQVGTGLDALACFRRGWYLLTRDFAVLAGWTILVAIIIMLVGLIPRVGWLVGMVVNNLLMAGVYLLFLARMRGFSPSIADLARVVQSSAIPIVLAGFAQLGMTAIGLVLLILPGIYLAVGYAFVIPLIIDRGMPVWEAMELSRTTVHKQWFQTFGLLLAAGLLLVGSAMLFGVGLIVTLPLCTAAIMFAYEDLFGR